MCKTGFYNAGARVVLQMRRVLSNHDHSNTSHTHTHIYIYIYISRNFVAIAIHTNVVSLGNAMQSVPIASFFRFSRSLTRRSTTINHCHNNAVRPSLRSQAPELVCVMYPQMPLLTVQAVMRVLQD